MGPLTIIQAARWLDLSSTRVRGLTLVRKRRAIRFGYRAGLFPL
jgi:hypothetical protein